MKRFLAVIVAAALCVTFAITAVGCSSSKTSYGPATGDAAAPVISREPSDLLLRKGEDTQGLSVEAYLKDGGSLSYQWYESETDANSGGTAVDGATKSVYKPDVSVEGTAYYYCVVTNTNNFVSGNKTAQTASEAAEVKVYSEAETPRIVEQPQGSSYVFGAQDSALPLSVEAAVSKGTLSYQWYSSEAGSYEDGVAIENATAAQYVPAIAERGETYYYCVVTNTDESASEAKAASATTKLACISIDYEYDSFIFEALSDTTCKLTAYNGSSLRPYIPETDEEGRAVVEIGAGVFAGTSIVEVTIPDTVETLGIFNSPGDSAGVFYNCSALQVINFGGHFKSVGDHCFSGCGALTTDVWAMCDQLESLGRGTFQRASMPEKLVIPATLTGSLGDWLFQYAGNIKEVTFAGDGVTSIMGSVFRGVSTLETVTIPASVTKVDDCFKECPALRSVTFERSLVADGSITTGVPFEGSDYPEMTIYVPEDSFDAYYTSLGAYGEYIDAPARTVTFDGATVNGSASLVLEKGEKLDAAAEVVYEGEDWVGWMYDGVYYADYAALAEAFVMSSTNVTLSVVYAADYADYTQAFTPSCSYQNLSVDSEKYTGTHEKLGELDGTRYTMASATDIKILNGQESHEEYDDTCPVSVTEDMYILLTFKNNKDEAITIRYEAEYWGVRGSVTVELPANGTRTALLIVGAAPADKDPSDTAFHQLRVVEGGESGYDVTIAGVRPADEYTLTVEGATMNGQSSFVMMRGAVLDAEAEIVYEGENLGWVYGGVWYETYQELAEAFVMPGADTTVRAVYAEDFAIAFTPSCRAEDKNLGTVYNMEHVSVADGVMGTRYKMEAGGPTYIKIVNGENESHGEADGVYNTCPLSEENKSSLLMTFTNNGETAITLRYETEFWGVRGSVTVELEAGESATVLLVSSPTPAGTGDSNAPFHQMEITSGGEAGYDVTVSGFRVV